MAHSDKPTSPTQSDTATDQVSPDPDKERTGGVAAAGRWDALAVGITAFIVAFVGAIVVLSIPYAILSAPLPPSVDRLGLSTEITQKFFFERAWYILVPSILFALWIGFTSYRWGLKSMQTAPDETEPGKKIG
ncbi:MAG: hypothetical protein GTN81_14250 [Proteobacteria bacterium]|nr:hypothetical protein [Pseudomonadota bacterium]